MRIDTVEKDWNSAEHLSDYQSYKCAATSNYNTNPIVNGASSAIFMHVAVKDYTSGCIAVSEELMIKLLRFIDKGIPPVVIVVSIDDLKQY